MQTSFFAAVFMLFISTITALPRPSELPFSNDPPQNNLYHETTYADQLSRATLTFADGNNITTTVAYVGAARSFQTAISATNVKLLRVEAGLDTTGNMVTAQSDNVLCSLRRDYSSRIAATLSKVEGEDFEVLGYEPVKITGIICELMS